MKKLKLSLILFLGLIIPSSTIFALPSFPGFATTVSEISATNIIDNLINDLFCPNENTDEILSLKRNITKTILGNEKNLFHYYIHHEIAYNIENLKQKTFGLIIDFIDKESEKALDFLLKTMDFGIYKDNKACQYQAAFKTKEKIRGWALNLISSYALDEKGTLASFFGKPHENRIREQLWFEINNFYPQTPR